MVKIFVGRLAPCVSSSQLRELFEKYGPVSDCDILRDYGFVHMSNEADAQRAIRALDKYDFCGSRLSVELSTSRSMKSCQLVVKNLPKGVALEDLHKLFKKFGTVTLCKINKENAIVHMRFPSMATNAVRNLSGEIFRGNVLSVEFVNNANKQVNDWSSQPRITSIGNTVTGVEQTNPVITTSHSVQRPYYEGQIDIVSNGTNGETNTTKADSPINPREKRRFKIKQGLKFLQSSMPWSGTAELYVTFLNQLKTLLLDEGLELFREGSSEEAVKQISEAINISNYMKIEGIQGHQDFQDRLFLERAVMKLHMGNPLEALQDAEEAFILTRGNDQSIIRLKARLLAQCGKWDEALSFMLKCQQTQNFDNESIRLLDIMKQNISARNEAASRLINNKGTIGDRRNRCTLAQNHSSNTVSDQKSFLLNQVLGASNYKTKDVATPTFTQPYSNFNGAYNSPIQNVLKIEGKVPNGESSFQTMYNQNYNSSSYLAQTSNVARSLSEYQSFAINSAKPSLTMPSNFYANGSSLFTPSLNDHRLRPNQNNVEKSYFASAELNQQPNTTVPSSASPKFWNGNCLESPALKSDSAIDNDLSRAMENKLKSNSFNSAPYSFQRSWSNKIDAINSTAEQSIPTYSHFSSDPSKGGYTGSVLGPAMLGISTSQSIKPAVQFNGFSKPPVNTPTENNVKSTNELLKEIFQAPLLHTHEFRLGCTDCVSPSGTKLLDSRHDETLVHLCMKNILLCRRRTTSSWFKVRPRPPITGEDAIYSLCKDLVTVKGCVQTDSCIFAHNKEEVDLWNMELKGHVNRSWLCKSSDSSFMKNHTLVDMLVTKHAGHFEFLCKACYYNKPRVISRFIDNDDKCSNSNSTHRNTVENRQLTHVLRENSMVRYNEIRTPQQPGMCERGAIFQCVRGSFCPLAHSQIERDTWAVMIKEKFSVGDLVVQSQQSFIKLSAEDKNTSNEKQKPVDGPLSEIKRRAKFLCSLCYKNGLFSESSNDMKFCTARVQHPWSDNKKVMLMQTQHKLWTHIRETPYIKANNSPARFELCENHMRQQNCAFGAKCSYAHSQEEMNVWSVMKEQELSDLDELYKAIIEQAKVLNGKTEASTQSVYHCWVCSKECNKSSWKEHCMSNLHLKKATSDNEGCWKYRKPGGSYGLCNNHQKGICECDMLPKNENTCPFAHSVEELKEWNLRRYYVLGRVRLAGDDGLLESVSLQNHLRIQSM